MSSIVRSIASLPTSERRKWIGSLSDAEIHHLHHHWPYWARPEQLPPECNWITWLILSGRGFGKTRTMLEWVRSEVCGDTPLGRGNAQHIALVAETAADARYVLVEGPAGLLKIHPPDFRPNYEPSKRRVTWPNGAVATLYNATEPDQLRGPQHDLAACDELAKWRYARETWDMLQFGLRLGTRPRQCVATTPRPIPLLKEIMADAGTVVTRGTTYDNRDNLAQSFFENIVKRYEGTRLGRQELKVEILDDVPGALWTRSNLDGNRKKSDHDSLPDMQRIVVAVDPNISEADADGVAETGIIAAGFGADNRGYVLGDYTCSEGPNGWARRACSAYDLHEADAIVVEINQGGAMVKQVIRSVRPRIPIIEVRASRGKVTRAEPIAALYEQNRVSHVGTFPELEDQMVLFTPLGIEGDTTADRVDALVWAFSELFPKIIGSQGRKNREIIVEGCSGYNPRGY